MHSYEIEIKTLLGSKEVANRLVDSLKREDEQLAHIEQNKQLNHYFNQPENLVALANAVMSFIPEDKKPALARIVEEGNKVSVRTREARDGDATPTVLFIIKASIGDDTSSNGVSRIEFEAPVDKTIDELDQILLDAGLTYQAKWSREREVYQSGDTSIMIDKNAGYGYLAEFERTVDDAEAAPTVEKELRDFMEKVGVAELPQDRLERMFAHYNEHWSEYYGTDKTFNIE